MRLTADGVHKEGVALCGVSVCLVVCNVEYEDVYDVQRFCTKFGGAFSGTREVCRDGVAFLV